MTRLIFLTASLIATTLNAKCQDSLQGKWYSFSSYGIVEWTITKDSLVSQEIDWDLKFRDSDQESITKIIDNKVVANGNIYLYLTNPKDNIKHLSLSTIRILNPKKEIIIAINSFDSSFTDTSLIRKYISNDLDEKYGYIFYSEPEIHSLEKQKNIKSMTVEDFKLYANKLSKFKGKIDSLSKVSNSPNTFKDFKYSMLRTIIGQIGYNPLITNRELIEFINHFHSNQETKEICDKLFLNYFK